MMETLQTEVYTALVSTGKPATHANAMGSRNLPGITYYESDNQEGGRADGSEHNSEVEYTIDVWETSPEECSATGKLVHTKLALLGLMRTFSYDVPDPEKGVFHKNMRYRGRILKNEVYQ